MLLKKKIVKNKRGNEKKTEENISFTQKALTFAEYLDKETFKWLLWRDLIACNHSKKC